MIVLIRTVQVKPTVHWSIAVVLASDIHIPLERRPGEEGYSYKALLLNNKWIRKHIMIQEVYKKDRTKSLPKMSCELLFFYILVKCLLGAVRKLGKCTN